MKGFQNLGNTCYINAGLQLIMNNLENKILPILNKYIPETTA